jgi:hypothetical protein
MSLPTLGRRSRHSTYASHTYVQHDASCCRADRDCANATAPLAAPACMAVNASACDPDPVYLPELANLNLVSRCCGTIAGASCMRLHASHSEAASAPSHYPMVMPLPPGHQGHLCRHCRPASAFFCGPFRCRLSHAWRPKMAAFCRSSEPVCPPVPTPAWCVTGACAAVAGTHGARGGHPAQAVCMYAGVHMACDRPHAACRATRMRSHRGCPCWQLPSLTYLLPSLHAHLFRPPT